MGWARKGGICCLVAGALGVLTGVVLLAALPSLIHNLVASVRLLLSSSALIYSILASPVQQVSLTESGGVLGHTAAIWASPPFVITMQFYLFNVTNADEIMTFGEKPAVIQHGPYGYMCPSRPHQLHVDGFYSVQ